MHRPATPETALYAPVKRYLERLGFTVKGDPQVGAPFALDLVLAGSEQHAKTGLSWSLAPADQANAQPDVTRIPLWSGQLAPRVSWDEGELLCRRLQTTLPADLTPGRYLMYLTTSEYDQPFGEVTIP